jgi:anti-sigma factor RsiW
MTKLKCINPDVIEEGDLMAYLHGDASLQVVEHIARCAFCSEQVEQMRMVDAQLLAAFYRDACPTAETLADFVLNRLSAPDKLRVAAHVRSCAACLEEIASVHDLTDEGQPSLLARLRESLALALIARPVIQVVAPARGESWQGRFEVDDVMVTLMFQADHLTGRVRRRRAPSDENYSGEAWLLSEEMVAEEETLHSEIDERGRFQFTAPPTGSYALLLQIAGQNVALEKVQVV